MRAGLIVILIGAMFLLKNLGIIDMTQWSILWPIIVLLLGISIVLRKTCRCNGRGCAKCEDTWSEGGCGCECGFCKECIVK